MSTNVVRLKEETERRSVSETRLVTLADFETWQRPRIQRPIRINQKVMEFSEDLRRSGGVITGVITLGQLPDDPTIYVVDGSHRIEGAKLSELVEFLVEIRIKQFATMSEMADEFVRLNSNLVRMRPDDILRALEENVPLLKRLREICPFIGYDNIRRCVTSSPVLGMTSLLRAWFGSSKDTPKFNTPGCPGELAEMLTDEDVEKLTVFLNTAYASWGKDPENYRLWGNLNLSMCMWMFRQLVLNREHATRRRSIILNVAQFGKCLMSVSAKQDYIDWLLGRNIAERDRSPCYSRLKTIFAARLMEESGSKKSLMRFPQPEWYSGSTKR